MAAYSNLLMKIHNIEILSTASAKGLLLTQNYKQITKNGLLPVSDRQPESSGWFQTLEAHQCPHASNWSLSKVYVADYMIDTLHDVGAGVTSKSPGSRFMVATLMSSPESPLPSSKLHERQGATMRRSIERPELRILDPFPLLNEFEDILFLLPLGFLITLIEVARGAPRRLPASPSGVHLAAFCKEGSAPTTASAATGGGAREAGGEVERGVAARDVTPVEGGGHARRPGLRSGGVGRRRDLRRLLLLLRNGVMVHAGREVVAEAAARTRGRGCGRRRRAPAPARAAHAGLRSLSPSPRALVLDFFCTDALDVAAELALPAYFLFTSSASALAVFLHLPVLHTRSAKCFRELGAEPLRVPGVPPLPADHMPLPILDRAGEAYEGFLGHSRRLARCAGIVVNTSRSLEPRAVDALIAAGLCVPDHERPRPPRPSTASARSDRTRGRGEECLAWLNSQPKASIVFLCFGSVGRFSAAQLKELTKGIEISGHRFLWVVRSPPSDDNDDPEKRFLPPPEPDLEKLLPEGFPYRTRERGMVVQSWAPQREVLAHESVGGLGYDIAPLRAAKRWPGSSFPAAGAPAGGRGAHMGWTGTC
ncbi:Anthocyanidin 5,3-O-glucosyltransferase [Ananas comosus]|uniref:Anthocyanidin 5,3-O-glucosyltransferase n=1 Tax=Ananas comosus TaxID=4615 RepID=A0A199UDN2_ANACO|nr:Anthocyanidin 5,3-O-glucosyltransferase [Ananas comosus]